MSDPERRKRRRIDVRERRKRLRNQVELADPALIEIRHTFGPVRKSVYKVLEHDEYGMSFLVPLVDGYFHPGVPLEYSLTKMDTPKVDGFGTVKYYHLHNDTSGNAYYKVGVENQPPKGLEPVSFRIRPERYNLAELRDSQSIHFSTTEDDHSLPLEDISRYSAAFYCSEDIALNLRVSSILESVVITFAGKNVYEGTVIVTRRRLNGDKHRIVVEPRNATFNLDIIKEQETLTSVSRSAKSLVIATKKQEIIADGFKAVVADMRAYLEGFQKILDMPMAAKLATGEENQHRFLAKLDKIFYTQWDHYVADLDRVVNALDLSDEEHGLYKSYLQGHLHTLLMEAPFCHRMYFKPLGYPGDFEMMRMIRDENYAGPTLFAKLVNKNVLQNPLALAARNRNGCLADRIVEFVEQCPSPVVKLLSVAAGPALEIQKLIEEHPEVADRIHLTLLDQEAEALRFSQDNIYLQRIMNSSSIQVDLVHKSIGAFLKHLVRGGTSEPEYDLVYIYGLFDYFDDRTSGFCLNQCAKLIKDDGRMIISNYSLDGHNYRTCLEYAFEWYIIYRNKRQMEQLGQMVKRPCTIKVDEDPSTVIKFLDIYFRAQQ
jgi:extracellular factor (EF) 3-hydroxypalmitic acid methyl ester biosynthesis protein